MRNTQIVTTSIPPKMIKEAERLAKSKHMTRSELFRQALRQYLEEASAMEAIRVYKEEKASGKLKTLKGSLADLM